MVVITIIAILAGVIISSVNSARNKGKDAKLKEEMAQLVNLAAINNSDYGDYCNLQPNTWISSSNTCATAFTTGEHASRAQEICNQIIENSADDPVYIPGIYPVGGLRLYSGTTTGCSNSFSFMTYLNKGKWYCVGSSGRSGEYASTPGNPGCFDNP